MVHTVAVPVQRTPIYLQREPIGGEYDHDDDHQSCDASLRRRPSTFGRSVSGFRSSTSSSNCLLIGRSSSTSPGGRCRRQGRAGRRNPIGSSPDTCSSASGGDSFLADSSRRRRCCRRRRSFALPKPAKHETVEQAHETQRNGVGQSEEQSVERAPALTRARQSSIYYNVFRFYSHIHTRNECEISTFARRQKKTLSVFHSV